MSDLIVYRMVREEDKTGVSGTGTVGWIVDWPNPMVTIGWCTDPWYSVATYPEMEAAKQIHGHGGATKFIQMWRFKDANQT